MSIHDYAPALDVLADAVIGSDDSDRVVYVNPAAERLLGWTRAELVGQPLTVLMPERMRPLHEAGFRHYMTTGKTRIMGVPVRVSALRKDGSEIDVELTLSPIPSEASRIVVASLRDLRDRVELERQILSQQRLAAHNAVMAIFAASERLEAAAPRMLRAIGEPLGWELGSFWVLDGGRALRCLATWHSAEVAEDAVDALCRGLSFAEGEGLPGRVWQTRKPVWVPDLRADTNFPRLRAGVAAALRGAFAFPVLVAACVIGVAEFFSRRVQSVDEELLSTAETLGRQIGQFMERDQTRSELERAEARTRFLADASAALAGSLDYTRTLRRVAELSVPAIADWCTVAAVDAGGSLRRVAVVHRDPAKSDRVGEYERAFPPELHRQGRYRDVSALRQSVFQPYVSDADLAAAAQDEDHLRILRELGCSSCIMVPMEVRGELFGVISLMRGETDRAFDAGDLRVAEELAKRAAVAVDNARLFRSVQEREESTRLMLEVSTVLNSSLDYEATFRTLAGMMVPRFADWCAVEVGDAGAIRPIAIAHSDPAKVAFVAELQRRFPARIDDRDGVAKVLRTGQPELYEQMPDTLLEAVAKDDEHLRLMRTLGLRSALIVPLAARGHTLGALTLVWAESQRRYARADLPLMEELGRRAGIALDNARLYGEAQRAVRLREEFLSIASHELKTPLTSLQLQVGHLQRTLGKETHEDPAIRRVAERIERIDLHVGRLGRLIEDLLDVSRVSAGQLALTVEEVDLSEVVQDIVSRYRDQIAGAGCSMSLALQARLVGRWDRMRLEQVVSNFLSNAIKYGAGQPIEIATEQTGAVARLRVRDHGIGIAREQHQQIFERWGRAAPSEHYGGLGLGLWIVRLFVEKMGGAVAVDSEPGKGATFTVELPLDAASSSAA